ncbi:MAG: rod shape-determining protein RodA [Candidatus Methylomirabilia bacterium]
MKIDRRLVQNMDWLLLAAALVVVGLGLTTLANLSLTRGSMIVSRQLAWAGIGLLALLLVASLDYRHLIRAAPALYVGGVGLLLAVSVVGRTVSGARRWIPLGPVSVQPSELFKLIFILTLVWVFTSRWSHPPSRGTVSLTLGLLVVPFLLIVKQPDLGSAVVLFPVVLVLLAGAGLRLLALGGLSLAGLAGMPVAWLLLKDYQRERLLVYLDPFRDPQGTAYHLIQSKIAIGSGQLLGKGIVDATQSRLAFLPERHTDFIFAAFAEMWGFVGCLVLITAYGVLLLRGFEIAATARDAGGRLTALGVTVLVATQTLANMGMATGLLPVVGLPLPLMSYGGSSMVVTMAGLGLLLSVRMRQFRVIGQGAAALGWR